MFLILSVSISKKRIYILALRNAHVHCQRKTFLSIILGGQRRKEVRSSSFLQASERVGFFDILFAGFEVGIMKG